MKFRLLKASEIECRVGQCKENGCSLLLYKDARVDMNLLDETVGSMNWKREHVLIDGNIYCTVSIWDENKKEWVSKQDVGTEANTEKEKSRASDSYKRACFNIGIGRELYTSPFIWIPLAKEEVTGNNGRYMPKTSFTVDQIGYDENREINMLVIKDRNGKERFSFGKGKSQVAPKKVEKKPEYKPVQTLEEFAKGIDPYDEANKAKTVEELKVIWEKHKDLHSNEMFKTLVTSKKKALSV